MARGSEKRKATEKKKLSENEEREKYIKTYKQTHVLIHTATHTHTSI